MPERLPNELFASWFLRSGWSKGELARLVNRRARDLGATHVATDTSRVRRWLDGEQPRDPIPRILTELFSERFGCVVTLSDLGLRESASPIAGALTEVPWSPERTAQLLAEFCRSDLILGRRGAGGAAPLAAGSALVEPVKRWLLPAPAPRAAGTANCAGATNPFGPTGPTTLTRPMGNGISTGTGTALANAAVPAPGSGAPSGIEANGSPPSGARVRPWASRTAILVEQLEEAARTFREWDAAVGGGIRRAAVVGQLYEVAEVLRQARDAAQPRLFRIAAQLALLAGEMALDSGLQATAQRYLILGLHCAKESGDRSLAAGLLATMGRQLIRLGRAQDALDLLAVGRAGAHGELEPLARALIEAVEARAHGALGRAEQCRQAAERAVASQELAGVRGRTPDWLAGYTSAALRAELGQAYRDLAERALQAAGRPAAQYAAQCAAEFEAAAALYESDGATRLRGRVTALIGVADARTLLGDGPAAAAALTAACRLAVRLRSRQTEEHLREVLARARQRFPQEPALRELTDSQREQAPAAGPLAVPAAALPLQAFTRS